MLSGFAKAVAQFLRLALAASLLLLLVQTDPSFTQAQTTSLSAPQAVLLLMQQSRFAAVRPQKPDHPDGHPLDLHPAVADTTFTPPCAKAAPAGLARSARPAPIPLGWQARAPPACVMPVPS